MSAQAQAAMGRIMPDRKTDKRNMTPHKTVRQKKAGTLPETGQKDCSRKYMQKKKKNRQDSADRHTGSTERRCYRQERRRQEVRKGGAADRERQMRDFIKELDEIKTAFRGYDREEMMIYIRELLKFCEEEKKKDMEKLIAQTGELRKELDGAKEREASIKAQYDALLGKFEKLSEAMQTIAKLMKIQMERTL